MIVDDSPECKKMAADLISEIISFTAGEKEGTDLYNITLVWLKDKKVSLGLLSHKINVEFG